MAEERTGRDERKRKAFAGGLKVDTLSKAVVSIPGIEIVAFIMAASMASLFSVNGQTAVVTGGTRGIGQAMAFALAEAGADVVLVQVCCKVVDGDGVD